MLSPVISDHHATPDAGSGVSLPQIVCQTQARILHLTRIAFSLQLQIDLVHHPQAAGAEWMTKTLQSTIGIILQLDRPSIVG